VVGMEFNFFNVVFTDGLIDFEGWGFGQIVGITIWLSVSTKVRYLEFSRSYHSFLSNVETTNSVRWVGKRNATALPTVGIDKDYYTRQILEYTIQKGTNASKQSLRVSKVASRIWVLILLQIQSNMK
jgi:hypothetical protein